MADNNIWSFQKEINKLERNSLNLKVGLVWLKFMDVLIAREFIVSLNDHRGAITTLSMSNMELFKYIIDVFSKKLVPTKSFIKEVWQRAKYTSGTLSRLSFHTVFSVTYVQGRQPIFHGIDAKGCTYSSIHKMIRY